MFEMSTSKKTDKLVTTSFLMVNCIISLRLNVREISEKLVYISQVSNNR